MDIRKIIMCPKCRGNISENMICEGCGKEYEYKCGVLNILYEDLTSDYMYSTWDIDEYDIEKTASEYKEFQKEYASFLNQETLDAQEKQGQFVQAKLKEMKGTLLDIATGRGMFLDEILASNNDKIEIICSDIDAKILAITKKIKNTDDRVSYLGTDGRHIALKDESIDNVVSYVGIANMPEPELSVSNIYRILKNGGTFLYKGIFIEKDSDSYKIAKEHGVEETLVLESLVELIKKSGFEKVEATVTSQAVWSENPFDGLPVAGDMVKYAVICASK